MKSLFILMSILCTNPLLNAATKDNQSKDKPQDKLIAKQRINCNMTVKNIKRPPRVDAFRKLFSEGILYGRLRSNTFIFDGAPDDVSHYSTGLGGNLTYKSARYKGFSFTTGLYTSQNPNHVRKEDLDNYRSGKDTFSRYAVATQDRDGMTALTENYLSYKKHHAEVKVGRFLLESYMLKSHDTKMIPVAFEGASLRIKTLPNTKIQLAYIDKMKLRDHEGFHRVLAYNDDTTTPYAQWTGNDDGAMHRGLTYSKLDAKGIDDRIIVVEGKNNSIDNTSFQFSYTAVPQLVSSLMVEGSYKFKLDSGLKIKPAIRYTHQFDDGAGAIGGANLKTNITGYKDPNSIENTILSSRIDFIYGAGSFRVGYSDVKEGGDIIAPWDAQPTGGYSRQMSGRNWYANTKTSMFRADYDLDKAGFLEGVHLMSRYTMQDFDDNKPGTTADSNIFTFDIVKRFKDNPNLLFKVRSAFVKEDHRVANLDGTFKKDPSYNELRLEMNYLF